LARREHDGSNANQRESNDFHSAPLRPWCDLGLGMSLLILGGALAFALAMIV
jgi:hypothetical protein